MRLPIIQRGSEGLIYLNKVYNKYVNLIESSEILNKMNKKDQLLNIDHACYVVVLRLVQMRARLYERMNYNPIYIYV
jgi:hypothetical protein